MGICILVTAYTLSNLKEISDTNDIYNSARSTTPWATPSVSIAPTFTTTPWAPPSATMAPTIAVSPSAIPTINHPIVRPIFTNISTPTPMPPTPSRVPKSSPTVRPSSTSTSTPTPTATWYPSLRPNMAKRKTPSVRPLPEQPIPTVMSQPRASILGARPSILGAQASVLAESQEGGEPTFTICVNGEYLTFPQSKYNEVTKLIQADPHHGGRRSSRKTRKYRKTRKNRRSN